MAVTQQLQPQESEDDDVPIIEVARSRQRRRLQLQRNHQRRPERECEQQHTPVVSSVCIPEVPKSEERTLNRSPESAMSRRRSLRKRRFFDSDSSRTSDADTVKKESGEDNNDKRTGTTCQIEKKTVTAPDATTHSQRQCSARRQSEVGNEQGDDGETNFECGSALRKRRVASRRLAQLESHQDIKKEEGIEGGREPVSSTKQQDRPNMRQRDKGRDKQPQAESSEVKHDPLKAVGKVDEVLHSRFVGGRRLRRRRTVKRSWN
eukprot:Lankesteria_metandrocarpae@DN1329_c0_g1_i1.p1